MKGLITFALCFTLLVSVGAIFAPTLIDLFFQHTTSGEFVTTTRGDLDRALFLCLLPIIVGFVGFLALGAMRAFRA